MRCAERTEGDAGGVVRLGPAIGEVCCARVDGVKLIVSAAVSVAITKNRFIETAKSP